MAGPGRSGGARGSCPRRRRGGCSAGAGGRAALHQLRAPAQGHQTREHPARPGHRAAETDRLWLWHLPAGHSLHSLCRVPRSDQAVFIHAALGQALIRRAVLSSLDAEYSSALEEGREPQAHLDAEPWEGEGAPGEAVPGGAAAAGDSEDNIKDDSLFLDLVSGRLKMMDFDSDTFSKAMLQMEFTDESTRRGCSQIWALHSLSRNQRFPFAGADAAHPSVGCQAAFGRAGGMGWGGYKMGVGSWPCQQPPAPTVPRAGAGLGQPARHKQTPMVGAEVGLQSLCRGCFAWQARKGLGCSTALVCFGITMGAVQGEGRKPGLPSPMGGFFPGMQGLGLPQALTESIVNAGEPNGKK